MASFALATYSRRDWADARADLYRCHGLRVAVVPEDDPQRAGWIIWECRVSAGDAGAVERATARLMGRTT